MIVSGSNIAIVILASRYPPNWDDVSFINKLMSSLLVSLLIKLVVLILGGSFISFSYFSHVYHKCSRIDFFFIDKTFLPAVKKTEYTTIIESNHLSFC